MKTRAYSAVLLVLTLAPATLRAQDKPGKGAPVDVQVRAIRATTKNAEISPELKNMAEQLKRQFRFTGFKLQKQASGKAPVGEAFATPLAGQYQARITPQKRDGERVQLEVEILQGEQRKLKANVTVPAGQYQLFGGLALDGGDQLIVAVSAR